MSTHGASRGPVFDRGLQAERTLLSWRRTCLAFGVLSLVVARFSLEALGLLALGVGVIGAGLAVFAYALTSVGYRQAHDALHARGELTRDGRPILAVVLGCLTIGVLCAGFLIVRTLG